MVFPKWEASQRQVSECWISCFQVHLTHLCGVLVVVLMISVFFQVQAWVHRCSSPPDDWHVPIFLAHSLYTIYIPNIAEKLTQILLVLSSKPSLCLSISFNWINPACCRYFPSIFLVVFPNFCWICDNCLTGFLMVPTSPLST